MNTKTNKSSNPAIWAGFEAPENMELAWKAVGYDGRTYNDFQWPLYATKVACDPTKVVKTNTDPCPSQVGDGLCLALTFDGAASGGTRAHTGLAIAYRSDNVLGSNNDKIRVSECEVLGVIDIPRLIRGNNAIGANLSGAYLSGANLSGAYLSDADLSCADLSGANLSGAYLTGAYLTGANLTRAYLYGAYLSGANLSLADLSDANLRRANLRRANLRRANLRRANLSGAYLSDADLSDADLSCADLSGAYLTNANLTNANLSGANLTGAIGLDK